MGTKNNPGSFDCYANARPDEPLFVLLARDPNAWWLVLIWAYQREAMGEEKEKIEEAIRCAAQMRQYCVEEFGKDPYHWLEEAAKQDSMFGDLLSFVRNCSTELH